MFHRSAPLGLFKCWGIDRPDRACNGHTGIGSGWSKPLDILTSGVRDRQISRKSTHVDSPIYDRLLHLLCRVAWHGQAARNAWSFLIVVVSTPWAAVWSFSGAGTAGDVEAGGMWLRAGGAGRADPIRTDIRQPDFDTIRVKHLCGNSLCFSLTNTHCMVLFCIESSTYHNMYRCYTMLWYVNYCYHCVTSCVIKCGLPC